MNPQQSPIQQRNPLLVAFVSVTTLFFAWGFITSMNDPLIPAVKAVFNLNYAESLLTQFAFFIAYGVVSIPGSAIVAKLGYGRSIVLALFAMIIGCLCIPLATQLERYEIVLIALFVIASGITVLQVAANPLSAALGPTDRSHFRLTFSQAFNSLGTVLGPRLGSKLMLSGGMFAGQGAVNAATIRAESLRNIDRAYFLMAGMLTALMIFIWRMRHHFKSQQQAETPSHTSLLAAFRSKWAVLGAIAIFFYVGSEVSVGSLMINFLNQNSVFGVSLKRAGDLLSTYYWGGAMIGRFVGSYVLTRVAAPRLLTIAAFVATLLCLAVSQVSGTVGGIAALGVGFFNSIMFPVIFTMTLERSTASAESTSSLLCMAIVGGALLPPLAGTVADAAGLHAAYLIPMVGYAIIAIIAAKAIRARVTASVQAQSAVKE